MCVKIKKITQMKKNDSPAKNLRRRQKQKYY
jgi:hypothetical protein